MKYIEVIEEYNGNGKKSLFIAGGITGNVAFISDWTGNYTAPP